MEDNTIRVATKQKLDYEKQLADLFSQIKLELKTFLLNHPQLVSQAQLELSLDDLHEEFKKELLHPQVNPKFVIGTTSKLRDFLDTLINPYSSPQKQQKALEDFQYYARGHHYSKETRTKINYAIAGIVLSITLIPITVFCFLIMPPIAAAIAAAGCWALGGLISWGNLYDMQEKATTNSLENRGKKVADNFKLLIKERKKFDNDCRDEHQSYMYFSP